MMRLLLGLVIVLILNSCGKSKDRNYDKGLDDGYARGYNSLCHPNTTNLIYGYFDNEDYSRGYNEGYASGRIDCQNYRGY